jgi:hypothetical protein
MEERVQELHILRQDRPDNDTFAISQTYHVDQFGRITLDLVSHTSIALRPKNETRGRAVGEQVSFAVGEPFFCLAGCATSAAQSKWKPKKKLLPLRPTTEPIDGHHSGRSRVTA